MAAGLKPDENRTRKMISRAQFGKPFAIHAGREISTTEIARIREIAPELRTDARELWWRLGGITSAVIAVATIDRCAIIHDGWLYDIYTRQKVCPLSERRWAFGPFVYMLSNVRPLREPVPCRGWQGFWSLTPKDQRSRGEVSEVERAILAQLEVTP